MFHLEQTLLGSTHFGVISMASGGGVAFWPSTVARETSSTPDTVHTFTPSPLTHITTCTPTHHNYSNETP